MVPTNVKKRDLWRYVNRKIRRVIHHYHVFSVLTFLFEEMIRDLKDGKEIKITNLGTLALKTMSPRRYHDVRLRKVMTSTGGRVLRFSIDPALRQKLCDSLDLDNLEGDEQDD